jgi:hypothetical protein
LAPAFLDRLPQSRAAWEYARDVHDGQTRLSDGAPFIEHPREVAILLDAVGAPDSLVAAGLLHDTVERAATTPSDLTRRFGAEVALLVAAVTEQRSIRSYHKRKAALREQATTSGESAAILFAADKIANVREYRQQPAQSTRRRASSAATPAPLHPEPARARSRDPTPSAGPHPAQRAGTTDVAEAAKVEPAVTRTVQKAIGEAEGNHVQALKDALADAQQKMAERRA